jgi:hypothetical protein
MSHFESNSWKKYEHYVTIEFDAINTDIWDVAEFSDPRNLTSPSDQVKKYILYPQRTYKMFFSPGMVTLSYDHMPENR